MLPSLPIPDDPEAAVARALVLRTLEPRQRRFWTLEAVAFPASPGDADFAALDRRWRALNRDGVRYVLHEAPTVTADLMRTVGRFPPDEQAYAFSIERARLTDSRELQREEDEFATELLGAGYASDVNWIARLNHLRHAGRELEAGWAAWSRTEARVGALTISRNPALERAVLEQPDSLERRLLYSEWLCEQPLGESYGEYLQLAAPGQPSWRAQLLLDHDLGVFGALCGFEVRVDWERGLMRSASISSSALATTLEHPGAFTLSSLGVELSREIPAPSVVPVGLLELSVAAREPPEGRLAEDLVSAVRVLTSGAAMEEVSVVGEGFLRLRELLAPVLPPTVRLRGGEDEVEGD